MNPRVTLIAWLVLMMAPTLSAQPDMWAEDGTTRQYYNINGLLEWEHRLGDWVDARGVPQGTMAYAATMVPDMDARQTVELDVTDLVREWHQGESPNRGFLLIGGNGKVAFHSREAGAESFRPVLLVETAGGLQRFPVTADVQLEPSTFRVMNKASFAVGRRPRALVYADLSGLPPTAEVIAATLQLQTTDKQFGITRLEVFRARPRSYAAEVPVTPGLAAAYPGDRGIEQHPDVVFAEGFESGNWLSRWHTHKPLPLFGAVSEDPAGDFEPLQGQALRATVQAGSNVGANLSYRFREAGLKEPEEIYFRYYLRFSPQFLNAIDDGKLPGIAGTYGRGGWGGRKSNGTNGWSARGHFRTPFRGNNPLSGHLPVGNYVYHAGQKGTYGDYFVWNHGYLGILEPNRWYCIEQHLVLDAPGSANGVLRTWVDGRAAFEKRDFDFRTTDALRIERIWINVYHGGRPVAPVDLPIYIDNVVVARRYIGPAGQ